MRFVGSLISEGHVELIAASSSLRETNSWFLSCEHLTDGAVTGLRTATTSRRAEEETVVTVKGSVLPENSDSLMMKSPLEIRGLRSDMCFLFV